MSARRTVGGSGGPNRGLIGMGRRLLSEAAGSEPKPSRLLSVFARVFTSQSISEANQMSTELLLHLQDADNAVGDLGEYLEGLWAQALSECESKLGPHDFKNVQKYGTYDDLVTALKYKTASYSKQPLPQILTQIGSCLDRLRAFTTVIAFVTRSQIVHTAVVWGVVNLLIELSQSSSARLGKIIEMLNNMTYDLTIFKEYEMIIKMHADLEDTVVTAFVEMIRFWSNTIQYLKKHPTANFFGHLFQSDFDSTRDRIQKQTARIKERAQARSLVQRNQPELWKNLKDLDIQSLDSGKGEDIKDEAELPCKNLPWPPDKNFYGRKTILDKLHAQLDHDPNNPTFKSWALYGMPGIGKTSTALAYAHSRVQAGVKAVLWVNAETANDINKSFTDIAVKLQLEGAEELGDALKNRFLLTRWLQKTNHDWLMVFDNAENVEDLLTCWPEASHGSILITSRAEMAFDSLAGQSVMPLFTESEGSDYLMKLVSRSSYSKDETVSATEFSKELGGLPLALNIVGTKIKVLRKPVGKYLDQYRKNPHRIHQEDKLKEKKGATNMYYPRGLHAVWGSAFGQFQEGECPEDDVLAIMGVLACLAPQDIPEDLFKPENPETLPPSLAFCEDDDSFDAALLPLLTHSLIRRDPDSGTLSVHRLVQDGFLEWFQADRAFESFRAAAKLAFEAFPKHSKGMGMRNEWSSCNKLVSHVLAMCTRYRQALWPSVCPGDLDTFTELLKSCGWFLMERGSWSEFQDLFATAEIVCEDKNGLAWAHLLNSAGQVDMERGSAVRSRPRMEKSLEIREKLCAADDMELSDAYNNFANLLITESEDEPSLKKTLEYYQKAIDIDEKVPDGDKVLHIRYLNVAEVYMCKKEWTKCEEYLELARDHAVRTFGEGTHFDGIIDYDLAASYLQRGRLKEARPKFERAVDILEKENATHVSVAAAQMKLAKLAMQEGKADEAITLLRKAEIICEANEQAKGDQGDTARALWYLSEAYSMKGDTGKAKELRDSAEKIRKTVQGPRYKDLPANEQSYGLMVWSTWR